MDIHMNAKIKCKNKEFLTKFCSFEYERRQENGSICCPMPNSSSTRSDKQKVELKDKVWQNQMLLLMNYDRYLMISRSLAGFYRKFKENDRLLTHAII